MVRDIARRTRFCLNCKTSDLVAHSFPTPVCNSSKLLVLGYYSWLRGRGYESLVTALGSSSHCSCNIAAQVWPGSKAQKKMGIWENQEMLQVRSSTPRGEMETCRCRVQMNSFKPPMHALSWGERHREGRRQQCLAQLNLFLSRSI